MSQKRTFPREIKEYYRDSYEQAKKLWKIREWTTLFMYVKEKRKQLEWILKKSQNGKTEESYNWTKLAFKLRKQELVPKFFPLKTLQKLVQSVGETGESLEQIFRESKNTSLQNPVVLSSATPRIDDLITSQSDINFSFVIEWISNAIDASSPNKQIGRFWEWFFQSLAEINIPWSDIKIDSKQAWNSAFQVVLEKRGKDIFVAPLEISQEKPGTKIALSKLLSSSHQNNIEDLIKRKFAYNTRAQVYINNQRINPFTWYSYLNGEALPDDTFLPRIDVQINEHEVSVIDQWVGMTAETIATKLLYPNTTTKERKKMSDTEVKTLSPKETRFFYEKKTKEKQKTQILLQVAGVVIEDFEVDTLYDIGRCVFEFPSFSPLEDSRNEIKVWRETTLALVSAFEKVIRLSSDMREKLWLIDMISQIYHHLKDRPSNIVDEEFTLSTKLKKSFNEVQKEIIKSWISVLPGSPELVDALGQRDDVFYIDPDFVDFDIDQIKEKTEILNIENPASFWYGKTYQFFFTPFSSTATYDYLIYNWYVFVNSHLFQAKTQEQQDTLWQIVNVSINLNTSYELASERKWYGRVLTSWEEKRKIHSWSKSIDWSSLDKADYESQQDSEKEAEKKIIVEQYGKFIEKYSKKIHFVAYPLRNIYPEEWQKTEDRVLLYIFNTLFPNSISPDRKVEDINESHYSELNEIITLCLSFFDRKNESIIRPTHAFIQKMIQNFRIQRDLDNIPLVIRYLKTLFRALDTEPQAVLDMMERFEGNFSIFEELWKVKNNNIKQIDTYVYDDERMTYILYVCYLRKKSLIR